MKSLRVYSERLKGKGTLPYYDDHTGEILEDRHSDCLKAAVAKLETLLKGIPNHGKGKLVWPIVVDLQHINELLDAIIEFMGI